MKQKEVIKPQWVPEAYRQLEQQANPKKMEFAGTHNSTVRPLTKRPVKRSKL